MQLTLSNELAEIPRLAAAVDEFCDPLLLAEEDRWAIHLALEEVVTNIITHGYVDGAAHRFTVELAAVAPERVRLTITDDAPAYNPLARSEVNIHLTLDERPVGGLGVHLVKNVMDHTAYARRDEQNILVLERILRPDAPTEGPSAAPA